MTVSPDKGYLVQGKSLLQIGNFLRASTPKQVRGNTNRFESPRRVFEGVLLQDLAAAASLDEPSKAQFQIKTLIYDSDAVADDRVVEVWSRARNAGFRSGHYGLAFEMYPNVFYWMPMDCSEITSSSSGIP